MTTNSLGEKRTPTKMVSAAGFSGHPADGPLGERGRQNNPLYTRWDGFVGTLIGRRTAKRMGGGSRMDIDVLWFLLIEYA